MAAVFVLARATPAKLTPTRNGEIMIPKRMTAAVFSACVLTVLASACSSDDNNTTTTINGSPIVSSPTVDTTGLDTLPVDTLGS
jgi:hypothetical protein